MKAPTSLASIAVLAMATMAPVVHATTCGIAAEGDNYKYIMQAYDLSSGDATTICGEFEKQLKEGRYSDCHSYSGFACSEEAEPYGPWLSLEFTVKSACSGLFVESLWWEATENKYGAMSCQNP